MFGFAIRRGIGDEHARGERGDDAIAIRARQGGGIAGVGGRECDEFHACLLGQKLACGAISNIMAINRLPREPIMKLFTIGYEGLNAQTFFGLLLKNQIHTLVDVRELPLSRKAGFSKSALAQNAQARGLNYAPFSALGCPREIRHAYRADTDWARYTRRFMAYIKTQDEAIANLATRALTESCCLMCFEADHNFCHRSYVAAQVAAVVGGKLEIVHLRATSPSQVVAPLAAQVATRTDRPTRR